MTSCFRFFLCLAATCSTLVLCADWVPAASRPRLDVTGQWDFYPDVGDATRDTVTAEPGKIQVPGAWQAPGYGESGGSSLYDGRFSRTTARFLAPPETKDWTPVGFRCAIGGP